MRGIILAGGKGTRLAPVTNIVCKQLLPVYDKPMIYYPLSVLMLADIRDILIISTPYDTPSFQKLFGNGNHLGLNISYAKQEQPKGIPEAFIIGKKFIGNHSVTLILGDNIFYGDKFPSLLKQAELMIGATIYPYYVKDPERYGVVTIDENENPIYIEEKPKHPISNWAITGLYTFHTGTCIVEFAESLKPSARGELEITDVLRLYLSKKALRLEFLGRGTAWLDTGTHESLVDASTFIRTVEERQGLKIGCIEEVAHFKGYIDSKQLEKLAREIPTSYGQYLLNILTRGKT